MRRWMRGGVVILIAVTTGCDGEPDARFVDRLLGAGPVASTSRSASPGAGPLGVATGLARAAVSGLGPATPHARGASPGSWMGSSWDLSGAPVSRARGVTSVTSGGGNVMADMLTTAAESDAGARSTSSHGTAPQSRGELAPAPGPSSSGNLLGPSAAGLTRVGDEGSGGEFKPAVLEGSEQASFDKPLQDA